MSTRADGKPKYLRCPSVSECSTDCLNFPTLKGVLMSERWPSQSFVDTLFQMTSDSVLQRSGHSKTKHHR